MPVITAHCYRKPSKGDEHLLWWLCCRCMSDYLAVEAATMNRARRTERKTEERHTQRERQKERQRQKAGEGKTVRKRVRKRERGRQRKRQRTQTWNLYKDCSLGSVKTCLTTSQREREREGSWPHRSLAVHVRRDRFNVWTWDHVFSHYFRAAGDQMSSLPCAALLWEPVGLLEEVQRFVAWAVFTWTDSITLNYTSLLTIWLPCIKAVYGQ